MSKRDIVTVAVLMLGGDTKFVELEDIAIKANELGPGLFTWRKHTGQIDKELVRVFLSDAKKEKYGAHLQKGDNDDWILTTSGVAFAHKLANRIDSAILQGRRLSEADKRRLTKERLRILATPAFRKATSGSSQSISPREAEEFFRLTPYVVGKRRTTKVQKLVNTFSGDPEIGSAIPVVAERLPER